MKKLVLPTIAALAAVTNAYAADLPRRAQPPVIVPLPVFTWTGFYAGINAGYVWGDSKANGHFISSSTGFSNSDLANLGLATPKYKGGGFAGGGQVGYNYQFTPGSGVVVGVEADFQATDLSRRHTGSITYGQTIGNYSLAGRVNAGSKYSQEYFGTVRGRLGYAFDRVLVYGTGGLAYGDVKYRTGFSDAYTLTYSGTPVYSALDNYAGRKNATRTGYTYGGGIEYALPVDSYLNVFKSSAVTLRAEYLHYDLGKQSVFTRYVGTPSVAVISTKVRNEGDLVRAGLNFKFNAF